MILLAACNSSEEKSDTDLFQKAGEKVEVGKYDEAIEILNKLLENEPDNELAKSALITLKLQQGQLNYNQALKMIEDVLRENPNNTLMLSLKASILSEISSPTETLKHIEKVIASNPNYFQSYHDKRIELMKLGRYKEAISAFDKALELEPYHRYSVTERALAKYKLGDKIGACKDWSEPGGGSWKYHEQYCE